LTVEPGRYERKTRSLEEDFYCKKKAISAARRKSCPSFESLFSRKQEESSMFIDFITKKNPNSLVDKKMGS